MNVEFLSDKCVNLGLRRAIPRDVTDILSIKHVARADTVPSSRGCLGTRNLASTLLILLERSRGIECATGSGSSWTIATLSNHIDVVLLASIFIVDTTSLLGLHERTADIDTVVVTEIVEPDILHGVVSRIRNQLQDTASPAVDAVVLELHNRPGAE